ncbi:VOC family protein [Sphingomicrobium lutaoense]|uniref:PhnB protein n=1 Tax=Sphingomicrobium lutaoense TaxID=515949 RepID=A0A839YZ04_9SPHN|nr:VOC family protein [Sphingomicrobium lutaoense]MBB3764369.1 PhnB protein [Sphingomicrobium lutaoense]
MAQPVPEGFHSVTPYLTVDDAAAAIDFYKRAFGAEEVMRLEMGDGIGHAEVKIGDSHLMLSDEWPDHGKLGPKSRGGTSTSMMLYVEDCDRAFRQAVDAGATEVRPVEDQFYGDRSGTLTDPFGHEWTIGTHKEDLSTETIQRRMHEMMAAQA